MKMSFFFFGVTFCSHQSPVLMVLGSIDMPKQKRGQNMYAAFFSTALALSALTSIFTFY